MSLLLLQAPIKAYFLLVALFICVGVGRCRAQVAYQGRYLTQISTMESVL